MDVPLRDYTGYLDKSGWSDGAWMTEPDKRQWLDPVSGFACLILRGDFGHLCGYVGVPPTHAAYGLLRAINHGLRQPLHITNIEQPRR